MLGETPANAEGDSKIESVRGDFYATHFVNLVADSALINDGNFHVGLRFARQKVPHVHL